MINLAKRVTIPKLSPSHSKARIVQVLKPYEQMSTPLATSSKDIYVECYDTIMVLECSPDLIADPADREYDDQKLMMIIETCEDGDLHLKQEVIEESQWFDVNTEIGIIVDDDDEVDDDWTWQAYFHDGST